VDHLGSTDVITDGTSAALGAVLERRSYDAFGAKRNPAWGAPGAGPWAAKTTVGFTGHESEEDAGLVNMKGRIFDPRVGRFLTTDPLVSQPGFSQSWNPYSYVLNRPLTLVDPSGFGEEANQGSSSAGPPPNAADPATWVWSTGDTGTPLVAAGLWEKEIVVTGKAINGAPQGDADMPAGDSLPPQDAPLKENAWVQGAGGFLSGLALGAVPGAGVAAEVATSAGVLDKGTRAARLGRAAGEMVGGFASMVLGGAGEIGGGAASLTGGGAVVGVPVMIGSAPLVIGGAANVAAGARGLAQALMSGGSGSTEPQKLRPEANLTGSGKHGVKWKEALARASKEQAPQGQWSAKDLEYATEKVSGLGPREKGWFDLPSDSTSVVVRPDGTTVRATRFWARNNGTGTWHGYPAE
jgi:RHS repeat-associated protein